MPGYTYTKPKPLKEVPVEDLGGGLNEASPPTEIPIRECLVAENIRVGEDGKTKEKRPGLTKLDSIYDFVSKKIYGAFGIEESDEVKIAAFLEDDIQLKSGNEWGSIFSPTKKINKSVSVVQDKGLVLVAGYEKLVTIKDGQAHYSGVEAPESAPTVGTEGASADKKIAEYPESNHDHCGELGQAATQTLLAQSFKPTVDCELTKITLKLKKVGTPTGNLWAEIHLTKSATSATKNASPGIVGQASDDLDVSTIRTSFVKVTDTSIAFVSSTKKIIDSNEGLAGFLTGDKIKVTGSVHNDGVYTVATGGVAGEIVVDEDLIDEDAEPSITIETIYELTFSGTKPSLDADKTYYLVIYRSFDVSPSDYVKVGFDCSSPEYEEGKHWQIDGSLDWGGYDSVDLVFKIYGKETEEKILLEYGFLETGSYQGLRTIFNNYLIAQSFKVESNCELTKIKLPLSKVLNPTGVVWVEIHSSQDGTSKDKNASTYIVGQASDDVNISEITADCSWIEFSFSGAKPSLTANTVYYLVLYCDYLGPSATKYVRWTQNDGYADGYFWNIIWDPIELTYEWKSGYPDTHDCPFKLYGTVTGEVKVQEYSFDNLDDIKELREAAGATLLAQEFLVYEDTDVTKVKLYLSKVGSLTGKFIWAEIHRGQGGTSTSKGLSDDIVGEASDSIDADSLPVFPDFGVDKVTDTTIAFVLATKKITDSNNGLAGFLTGDKIKVVGSASNDGTYTIATGGVAGEIVVTESLVDEDAGPSITIEKIWVTFTFSGVKPDIKADTAYWIVIYGDFDVSSSNYVKVGMDKIDPTYTVGNRWDIDEELGWTAKESIDLMFELWTVITDVLGTYSYVITYLRWGNFPCESNPSPPSETIELTAGNVAKLTNIPVSSEPEVTHKNIYRNKAGEEKRYWVERIENSVTEYEDSLPDSGLGDEVSYESYPPPIGDSIEIWDDCLWVCGVEDYPESLFRSRRGYLEQFKSTALSIFPLREDEASPVLRVKEFNNYLYPFKKTSIWVISRSGGSLVVDKLIDGIGTIAGPNVAECGDKRLRFLSNYYEIEEFDGWNLTTMELPNKVKKVLKTINKTYAHRSVARNHAEENEYRLAIPTGSSMVPNKVIVYNYKDKNFFIDTYHQNICSISVLAIEKGVRVMLYGTEQGELYKVDPDATTDDGQLINMRFRTGWIGSQSWMVLRRMWVDFILPADKKLIFKVYSNFRDSPELNINLEGSTPTGPNPELRNVIHQKVGMAIKGSFFSFEFINTEDIEGLLQVIKFWLYLKTRPGKRTIKAE